MATITTLAVPIGSSHGSGHTGSQSSPIAPNAQHQTQQANTVSSTTSALQSPPSPASRPTLPSSSATASSLVQPSTAPTPQTPRTKLRRYWNKFQTIALLVVGIFTIASFFRDYFDIKKDSPPSPQELWELQNDFRLSCEYDRRAKLQSDACDLALSKPATPPPGISKRALQERSVRQGFEFVGYNFKWVFQRVLRERRAEQEDKSFIYVFHGILSEAWTPPPGISKRALQERSVRQGFEFVGYNFKWVFERVFCKRRAEQQDKSLEYVMTALSIAVSLATVMIAVWRFMDQRQRLDRWDGRVSLIDRAKRAFTLERFLEAML
ncbi:hypothetical protein MBLNU13_g01006t1 [Cladosporium sp. NU13]